MSAPQLSTTYMGLDLVSPVVASAGPFNRRLDKLIEIEAAGAGAVVLPSLFAEEIEAEALAADSVLDTGDAFAEFDSAPLAGLSVSGTASTDRYVELVGDAAEALSIPVIASLNGARPGDWARYGRLLADAGADGLELNLYDVAADPALTAADVEDRHLAVIAEVREAVGGLPLALKISPYLSSLANFAPRARAAGADALVLFNRFYGPDIDLEELTVTPRLALSTRAELPLRLRWAGILAAQCPDLQIAVTGGVHGGADVVKSLIVGARVACTTSAVLDEGPGVIATMLDQLRDWLAARGYGSVDQLRGAMDAHSVDDPAAFERAQYVKVLHSWS